MADTRSPEQRNRDAFRAVAPTGSSVSTPEARRTIREYSGAVTPDLSRRSSAQTAIAPTFAAARASAPVAAAIAARTYTPTVKPYAIGATPQVSTNPLTGVPTQYIPDLNAVPLVGKTGYVPLSGSAPLVNPVDIMPHAQAALDMLDYFGEERVGAARAAEIERGMGRSGVALGVEDRVRYETDIAKAAEYAEYSARQAEIDTQMSLANQQAQLKWSEMLDASQQFRAQQQQARDLANQDARIRMAGLEVQWASTLADIAYKREALNSQMKATYEDLRRSANEFDRTIEASNFFNNESNRLAYADLNERARQADQTYSVNYQGMVNDYNLGTANLAASTVKAQDTQSIVNDAMGVLQNSGSYDDAQGYLDIVLPGWRSNAAITRMFSAPATRTSSGSVLGTVDAFGRPYSAGL